VDVALLGRKPVSPDRPCGEDIRYDPQFEQLQAQIDKLSLPSASGAISWEKVVQLSAGILAEKSKDLRVACYWALGRLNIDGLEGLNEGLALLRELMGRYWDGLFPPLKRLHGRSAALQWWIEKAETALSQMDRSALPAKQLAEIAAGLEAVDELMRAHLPEPPLIRPLQRAIEMFPVAREADPPRPSPPPQPAAPPEPAPAAKPQPAPAAVLPAQAPRTAPPETEKAVGPPPIPSAAAAHNAIGAALDELRRAAARLQDLAPQDPTAYRCRRQAAWLRVNTLPAAAGGRTQVPPPPPQAGMELAEFHRDGNWPALLRNAEQKVNQFIFWLDLQRWSAAALAQSGTDYHLALESVRRETAGFLNRLPGIAELSFSNGVPFADPETRLWLSEVAAEPGSPPGKEPALPPSGGPGKPAQELLRAVEQAAALARADKLVEATRLIDGGLRSAPSQRLALRWRLALCRLLLQAKRPDMALPHAEIILATIDRYHLESWDPELSLDALQAAWTAYSRQNEKTARDHAQAVFNRIARIDPVKALQIKAS
jgi:type VI secretion system protein VasJ